LGFVLLRHRKNYWRTIFVRSERINSIGCATCWYFCTLF
jgi:Pyruvate/2-oxoacid:ferredoxin oxidoreductase delta subunit